MLRSKSTVVPKMKNQRMSLFCAALVLTAGRCTDEQHFQTKTVHFGEDVTLTCSRSSSAGLLFWVKLAPGHLPDVVASTYTFGGAVNTTPRVTARHEPGTFVLRINNLELSDTAFYYCERFDELKKYILNTTFLRVKGPEPDVIAVIQHFSSGPVRPGDSMTLQCSVVYNADYRMCADPSVYWFRAGSDASHPVFIYVNESDDGECETSSETPSSHKCVYSFSRHNISSSDAGTYYCAVATCGHILFGNGEKLDIDGNTPSLADWFITVFAAVAVSVTVTAILIYSMRKCDCSSGPVIRKAVGASDGLCCQQAVEDTLHYSAVTFTVMKSDGIRKAEAEETKSGGCCPGVTAGFQTKPPHPCMK